MRYPQLGNIDGLAEEFGNEFAIELYRRGNFTHHFEMCLKEVYLQGKMKLPIYLCLGTEFNSAALSMVLDKPDIFGQHRAHGTYLAFGGNPNELRDELLGLETGCASGMAGSNAIQCKEINLYGHSGLMGEQVPISVGSAFATKNLTLSICGDASFEEDYIYPSLGWAATKELPIVFICEDNNLSILTEVEVRRTWKATDIAGATGMFSIDIADDPWVLAHYAKQIAESGKPGFINIHTVRTHWHAGTGVDGEPEWDRYELITKKLIEMGLDKEIKEIDLKNKERARVIWEKQLQKQ